MYGVANIMTLNQSDRDAAMEQDGYDDKEDFADEEGSILGAIEKSGLSLHLIKIGSALVLPYFMESKSSDFYKGLMELEEAVSMATIVSYIIDHLDSDYVTTFKVGNTIDDVIAYQQLLEKQEPTPSVQSTENLRKPIAARRVINASSIEDLYANNEEDAEPKWTGLHDRLVNRLAESHLDESRTEEILARIRQFAELLADTDQNDRLYELYLSLRHVKGITGLKNSYDALQKDGSNENRAKYSAASHKVMQNLWRCLEDYKEQYIASKGRFRYLAAKYANAYQQLTRQVIGQDYAVNEFVQACFNAELYGNEPNHPQAAFLFAGPPGVGKTFLARNVAELLGRPFRIFDMASYTTKWSDLNLLGVENGYRNAHEGDLVSYVEDHPDAIILFDEIEKADPVITRLFLSVLEGARLDNRFLTSTTSFSNTILIFTTNAGRALYENNRNLSATPTDVIIRELSKEKRSDSEEPAFPPELCSRLASQHIVMFNHIGISDMVRLIMQNMDESCTGIESKLNVHVEYDHRLALLLLMHFGNIDARVVTSQAQQFIKKEIYELSRHLIGSQGAGNIQGIHLSIDDFRISDKAKAFFAAADTEEATIAVVCDKEIREQLEGAVTERIRLRFVETEAQLLECDPDDITLFLVDPYYAMRKVDDKILGLDDYDSIGLRIIKTLLQKNTSAPVYLLESDRKVSQTDRNTFYMRGVEDTVSLDGSDLSSLMSDLAARQILQKNCMALLNRRKIFDFESLQEAPDDKGHVHIKFYDITVKDAVNPEDQDLLINIEERPDVKFDDVIGAENAKAEFRDFARYLENPKAYMQNSLAVPKGILLYGPPGTGKTMLARALAGETDATFLSMSAAKLRDSGAGSIERLFNTARKYAPAIIFLDEVDAIARRRTGSVYSSYDESLLNMLLTQMDGFEQHKNLPVFIVAATNFGIDVSDDPAEGVLDPAFLRRFGNKILIDQPNREERTLFLSRRLHGDGALRNDVTNNGINNIAERTPGDSLATIENILELAYRNAARKQIALNDNVLEEAMEEYFYGEKRTRNEDQVYRTAVHEASHAYIYWLSGKKPTYLTVISRGNFGGYMQREDEEDKATTSKEEFLWSIRTSLAGRIGEMVVFGDTAALNTGASSDLRKASSLALNMLITYGMDDEHRFCMPYEQLVQSNLLPAYVERAEMILQQQERECYALIEQGKDTIIAVARALLEKNHLNREEIAELMG